MNESDKSFMWCELMHLWSNMWWDAPQDPEHVDPKYRYRNAAGSDPIGGVGSGGVVELCLTFPLFHHSTLPLTSQRARCPLSQSHTACR